MSAAKLVIKTDTPVKLFRQICSDFQAHLIILEDETINRSSRITLSKNMPSSEPKDDTKRCLSIDPHSVIAEQSTVSFSPDLSNTSFAGFCVNKC